MILCGKGVENWRPVCQGRCQRRRDFYKLCHLPAPQQAEISAGSFLLSPWDWLCLCHTFSREEWTGSQMKGHSTCDGCKTYIDAAHGGEKGCHPGFRQQIYLKTSCLSTARDYIQSLHLREFGIHPWAPKGFGFNFNAEHGEPHSALTDSSVLVYSLGSVDTVEVGGSLPLQPLPIAVSAFMFHFISKKSC